MQINLVKTLWYELQVAVLDRFDRRLGKLIHLNEPLLFDQWLNSCMAAVMCTYIMRMWNHFNQKSLLLQFFYHNLTRFVTVHTCVFTAVFIDRTIIIHDVDLWQIVTLTNLKIVRVVCRCNLNRTCSKFFIYIVICYNRNLFVNQRQNYILSYQLFIALIIRMYCDRSITKHSLRTGSSDLKVIITSYDRILDMPEMSILLLMLNLCV